MKHFLSTLVTLLVFSSQAAAGHGLEVQAVSDNVYALVGEMEQRSAENLANNAIEAMPEGGRLSLALWTEGEDVTIEMVDTGCGIEEQDQRHVFEPFFSTKEAFGTGSHGDDGLGLAVVHGLVRDMGGTIRLRSRSGEGCQVEIKLPIRRPEST